MTINNSGDVAKLPPQPCVKQTAGYHAVDPKTVRRWIAEGRLSAKRIGPRLIRLDRDEVLSLLKIDMQHDPAFLRPHFLEIPLSGSHEQGDVSS